MSELGWMLGGVGVGALLGILMALWISLLVLWIRCGGRDSGMRSGNRVLLVTAHPDDECMFFAPSLADLRRRGVDVWLLCLSSGNYRNEGKTRKEELWRAAEELALGREKVIVVEHSKLPDHPSKQWPKAVVADIVLGWVERLSASAILTFDVGGVSGHKNHSAVFRGVQNLYSSGRLPVDTSVFVLESVCILRKYGGILDLPFSLRFSPFVFVADWSCLRRTWAGMRNGHRSQMLWFRYLYLLFSRYLYLNSFKRMPPAERQPTSTASSPTGSVLQRLKQSSTPPPTSSPTRRPLTARSPLIS